MEKFAVKKVKLTGNIALSTTTIDLSADNYDIIFMQQLFLSKEILRYIY